MTATHLTARACLVAAFATAALLASACDDPMGDKAQRQFNVDYCRGALSVARTAADTIALFRKGAGWQGVDGSQCAALVGQDIAPRGAK